MTGSYPALRELINRLEGKDKKICQLALHCLERQDNQIEKYRATLDFIRKAFNGHDHSHRPADPSDDT